MVRINESTSELFAKYDFTGSAEFLGIKILQKGDLYYLANGVVAGTIYERTDLGTLEDSIKSSVEVCESLSETHPGFLTMSREDIEEHVRKNFWGNPKLLIGLHSQGNDYVNIAKVMPRCPVQELYNLAYLKSKTPKKGAGLGVSYSGRWGRAEGKLPLENLQQQIGSDFEVNPENIGRIDPEILRKMFYNGGMEDLSISKENCIKAYMNLIKKEWLDTSK